MLKEINESTWHLTVFAQWHITWELVLIWRICSKVSVGKTDCSYLWMTVFRDIWDNLNGFPKPCDLMLLFPRPAYMCPSTFNHFAISMLLKSLYTTRRGASHLDAAEDDRSTRLWLLWRFNSNSRRATSATTLSSKLSSLSLLPQPLLWTVV